MIVVDASVLAPALIDDTAVGAAPRRRLSGERLAAPELIHIEVLSVIRRLHLRGEVGRRRANQAAEELTQIAIQRFSHRPLLSRCWELRDNVTSYDAAYIALAEGLGVPLVTADARLAGAPGIACEVEVLTG